MGVKLHLPVQGKNCGLSHIPQYFLANGGIKPSTVLGPVTLASLLS
jgi:hypothetical protein